MGGHTPRMLWGAVGTMAICFQEPSDLYRLQMPPLRRTRGEGSVRSQLRLGCRELLVFCTVSGKAAVPLCRGRNSWTSALNSLGEPSEVHFSTGAVASLPVRFLSGGLAQRSSSICRHFRASSVAET